MCWTTFGVVLEVSFYLSSCTPHPHAKQHRPPAPGTQKLGEKLSALSRPSCSLRSWHTQRAALAWLPWSSLWVLHLVLGPHFLWDVDKLKPIKRGVTEKLRGCRKSVWRSGEEVLLFPWHLFAATGRVSSPSAHVWRPTCDRQSKGTLGDSRGEERTGTERRN